MAGTAGTSQAHSESGVLGEKGALGGSGTAGEGESDPDASQVLERQTAFKLLKTLAKMLRDLKGNQEKHELDGKMGTQGDQAEDQRDSVTFMLFENMMAKGREFKDDDSASDVSSASGEDRNHNLRNPKF